MEQKEDIAGPWVILVDSATQEQAVALGPIIGAAGVTGRFARGTLAEVFERECLVEAQKRRDERR